MRTNQRRNEDLTNSSEKHWWTHCLCCRIHIYYIYIYIYVNYNCSSAPLLSVKSGDYTVVSYGSNF